MGFYLVFAIRDPPPDCVCEDAPFIVGRMTFTKIIATYGLATRSPTSSPKTPRLYFITFLLQRRPLLGYYLERLVLDFPKRLYFRIVDGGSWVFYMGGTNLRVVIFCQIDTLLSR